MITRRVLYSLATLMVAATLAGRASASLLAPGTGGGPDPLAGPLPVGETRVGTFTGTFSTPTFSGSFVEEVWRWDIANPSLPGATPGTLDFLFQFTNNATSTDAINLLTVGDYNKAWAGPVVDVGIAAPNATPLYTTTFGGLFSPVGTAVPTSVSRSSGSGSAVHFAFLAGVAAGTTTEILAVETYATQFNGGTFAVQDQFNTTVLDLGPVPEASTVVGFGALLGLGGFGMLRLRRRSSHAASV